MSVRPPASSYPESPWRRKTRDTPVLPGPYRHSSCSGMENLDRSFQVVGGLIRCAALLLFFLLTWPIGIIFYILCDTKE